MDSPNFHIEQNQRGAITKLILKHDPTQMNWVIDPEYLKSLDYHDEDKLFGEFHITVNGHEYRSVETTPIISQDVKQTQLAFLFKNFKVIEMFTLKNEQLNWQIQLINSGSSKLKIDDFGIWISLAYIMFRDKNVSRNANQSAAVFPSISPAYTKLAAVRRDNTAPNLGVYQLRGRVLSVGTYNDYTNRFFENVSPSLDGMLFHEFILAGGYQDDKRPHHDWIYSQDTLQLSAHQSLTWQFGLHSYTDQPDFYRIARQLGHPRVTFAPLIQHDQAQTIQIVPANGQQVSAVLDRCHQGNKESVTDLTPNLKNGQVRFKPQGLGEHEIIVHFNDETTDIGVFNVMDTVAKLLRERADYLCSHSYSGSSGKTPYSFSPISNQGESLGKMTFVLQECLLDQQLLNPAEKIATVEESAVKYVRPKWFVGGDFKRPRRLYGDFYRVMDLEYIAHLFYLLSKCPAKFLKLNSPKTYLTWVAEVFDVRVNPNLHDNERGKTEAQMLGGYFMYIQDLLKDVKNAGLEREFEEISHSWQQVTNRVEASSDQLLAAMTEHFFDNAGFGPAAAALALTNNQKGAKTYGELLKANIGFSNDFRAQSPDRWWEALSYMIHALWGGVTAAAAQITGEILGDVSLVQAAYRATNAVLYMYDTNATATDRQLKPGQAASTYSIAGPNVNRPDLSRNRFGQSIFASNGGIFSKLFPDGYTGEDDWDMGEELVDYLNGFGQITYLYSDQKGNYHAINGLMEKRNDRQYQLKSFAPYLRKYVNLDNGRRFYSTKTTVTFDRQTQEIHES